MNAAATSTAELARLNWRLGMAYAEAVNATVKQHAVKLDLIGCHGQTLYHQPRAESYAGRRFACTWQAGEAAVIAAAARGSGGLELPPGGYAGRGPGSAAGSAAGLCAICRREARARACRISAASPT